MSTLSLSSLSQFLPHRRVIGHQSSESFSTTDSELAAWNLTGISLVHEFRKWPTPHPHTNGVMECKVELFRSSFGSRLVNDWWWPVFEDLATEAHPSKFGGFGLVLLLFADSEKTL